MPKTRLETHLDRAVSRRWTIKEPGLALEKAVKEMTILIIWSSTKSQISC